MSMMPINWTPSRRELRWFAGLLIVFFAGIAAAWARRSGLTAGPVILFAVTATIGLIGLVAPEAIRRVYVGWMIAVWPLGWLVSHVLLATIFFGIITPIGLALRICGLDPMKKSLDRSAKSYWIPRSSDPSNSERYFRQF